MLYHDGWDYFSFKAGSVEQKTCLVCLNPLEVTRDQLVTKNKWGVLEKEPYLVDVFTCSAWDQPWHQQLIALLKEADRTPSSKLEQVLRQEIEELRVSKQATKKWNIFW